MKTKKQRLNSVWLTLYQQFLIVPSQRMGEKKMKPQFSGLKTARRIQESVQFIGKSKTLDFEDNQLPYRKIFTSGHCDFH